MVAFDGPRQTCDYADLLAVLGRAAQGALRVTV